MGLKLAYIILAVIMLIILCFIGFRAIDKTFTDASKIKRKKTLLVLGLLFWQVYLYLISISGILQNFELPPRFPIFLIIPLFIFTGIFLYLNRNNRWLQNIPKTWPVFYQSFRVSIETLFVYTVASGILHKEVTMEGYNYDIFFGISALIVGFLFSNKKVSRNFVIGWNYFGLILIAFIIFLFMSTIFAPQLYGSDSPLMPLAAVTYPYTLVAGFLMPSAVFMHVLSILQLRSR